MPRSIGPDNRTLEKGIGDCTVIKPGYVQVRGAREHNLKNVDVDIPRNALVVFTGISGSGKSSLAFGTLYAEAQRRYLDSVALYARRLIEQVGTPAVDSIDGLPPAVALMQRRGATTPRSSVGSVTTLSNLLRMLYSRAGRYRAGQARLDSNAFSPNLPEGACPECHGIGHIFDATESSLVPDDSLTIRQRAVAAWPPAWHGQNLREILVSLGFDIDRPWRELSERDRNWILFTDEQPVVPVYPGLNPKEMRDAIRERRPGSYQGTFSSARRYVLHTFATTPSAAIKKRVSRHLVSKLCPACGGMRLRPEALSVTFAGLDITQAYGMPLDRLAHWLSGQLQCSPGDESLKSGPSANAIAANHILKDLHDRIEALVELGLGYLSLDRSTPTLSPGELQRLRLATQIKSNLFGVVYVLDEPTAGLHPADAQALLVAFEQLKARGNSLFVVEHDLDVMRRADWIVDVGPGAGEEGGSVLYSGPVPGLETVDVSQTRRYLFDHAGPASSKERTPTGWLKLTRVNHNNLRQLDAEFPLGVLTTVTGVSGSGKSSLVSQALVELVTGELGGAVRDSDDEDENEEPRLPGDSSAVRIGGITGGDLGGITRLVRIDQKPIGRSPRSNLATYTGLFDHVRRLFAGTPQAKSRGYGSSRFSFNRPRGRCPICGGEGFVTIELLFLPSVSAPCSVCHGARYNADTLEITYNGKNIAEVLALTVDDAGNFFADCAPVMRSLDTLRLIGLGYLRLGQPATELSGGEAQRIKLATELQRAPRDRALYVLDEPTTGLHPADVDKLLTQLNGLVDTGHTVIIVEHDMAVAASSDWVIDMGPGAGEAGGTIIACGRPRDICHSPESRTSMYLRAYMDDQATAH